MLTGSIRKTVWKYGIPCALITLINTLYNIVDQITILFVVNNNLLTTYGAQSRFGAEIPLATYGIMMKLCRLARPIRGAILTISRNLLLCTFSGLALCPLIGVSGVMYEGLIADGGSAVLSAILLAWEMRLLQPKI